jgi:hypothetical protein
MLLKFPFVCTYRKHQGNTSLEVNLTVASSSLSNDTEIAEKLWSASSTILKEIVLKADKIINS